MSFEVQRVVGVEGRRHLKSSTVWRLENGGPKGGQFWVYSEFSCSGEGRAEKRSVSIATQNSDMKVSQMGVSEN